MCPGPRDPGCRPSLPAMTICCLLCNGEAVVEMTPEPVAMDELVPYQKIDQCGAGVAPWPEPADDAADRVPFLSRGSGSFREQFMVSVRKPESGKLGISVTALPRERALLVKSVKPGPVQDWNEAHPDEAVRSGDLVVAVNGVSSDPDLMYDEIARCKTLAFRVARA
mmetsp:Transcript_35646/g.99683  ORF Transcript_35646/g.99683 Transcript_35646/m.99683 type:complete len:167 (-) Transcript_35646:128-628(-)